MILLFWATMEPIADEVLKIQCEVVRLRIQIPTDSVWPQARYLVWSSSASRTRQIIIPNTYWMLNTCHALLLPYLPSVATAASAKSLQSCLTLCNPTDGSPPGSSIPGILQAKILEWVAISFSKACMRCHRRQPTRPLHPWDSPGKNTGVGCHFLLQCMHAW